MNHEPAVYIIDDEPVVRKALKFLLESVNWKVEIYSSAGEFLALPQLPQAGCLLLDIRMPGMNGMQLHSLLREKHCPLPVIFITGHGDVHLAVQAMKQGAFDFIEKPFHDNDLLQIIQKAVLHNQTGLAENQQSEKFSQLYQTLSPREKQVLLGLVAGKLNKMIAAELGISHKTVEIHRGHVMAKLQAQSLAEIVRDFTLCQSRGLIPS